MTGSPVSVLADIVQRDRKRWGGMAWVVALLMTGFGGGYLLFGAAATAAPQTFVVLTSRLPGGLHTYGAILLLPALAMVHGLAMASHRHLNMPDRYMHYVLLFAVVIALSVVAMFITSWVESGAPTWGGILVWLAIAAFAAILRKWPPVPPSGETRGP